MIWNPQLPISCKSFPLSLLYWTERKKTVYIRTKTDLDYLLYMGI